MKKIKLTDNTSIYCLKSSEAIILDEHINAYLSYGIDIKNGDTIIDVGANIGLLGLRLSQTFADLTIHAFEPIPEIYKVLKKNSSISCNTNFYSHMMGISNYNKEKKFTYFPNSPALSTSQPEIWDDDKENLTSAVQGNITHAPKQFWWAKFIPKFITPLIVKYLTSNSQIIKSNVITLSTFIEKYNIKDINLLKIDCEGEELNVLQGIKSSDWSIIKAVVMEVNDINNNMAKTKALLFKHAFKNISVEKEKGFEQTKLFNIYAHR